MIDRRTFLAGTGAVVLAAPLAAEGQPERKRPRIALLFANTPAADITGPQPVLRDARAFLDGMRDLGWLDGQNITIERRSAEGQPDRYSALVQEMMGLHVDLMVTGGPFVKMIKQASDTMPIVVAGGGADALVQQGLVADLAFPFPSASQRAISWLKVSVALRYALTFPWTPEAQLNVAPAAGMLYVGQQACQSAPQ